MASHSQPSYLQPSSWLSFVSVGGLASLGVSAVLFQLAGHHDGRISNLDRAQALETLASACRLDTMLPLLVAVRGRVTCREPSKCELSGTPAVMRELVEEEVYFKEHSSGRVTQECFEVRREQEQREAFLEDLTGSIRVENLQQAAGLAGLMEVKQVFRPVDIMQGTLIQHVINKAFKSMVKHGVRATERYLPANTTVTVVGELVADSLGRFNNSYQHLGGTAGSSAGQGEQRQTGKADVRPAASPSSSPAGWDVGSGAGASGRPSAGATAAAVAAAAGAELLGQAAAAGGAALQVLPYTLRMPDHGPFHVTVLTLPQLRSAMEQTSRAIRAFAWGFGVLGAVLVARKAALQLWRIREHRRLQRMLAEADAARRKRQAQRAAEAGAGAEAPAGGADAGPDGDYDGVRGPCTCVVCLDRDTDVVFSGCGHMCVCYACSTGLQRCPICRVASRTIRVFRP